MGKKSVRRERKPFHEKNAAANTLSKWNAPTPPTCTSKKVGGEKKKCSEKQGKRTSLLWCPACFGTALVSVCLQTSLVAELILPQTQVQRSGSRHRTGGTSNHQGKKNGKRSVRRAVRKNGGRWKGTSDNVWTAERYTRSPKGTGFFFKAPAKTSRVPTLGFPFVRGFALSMQADVSLPVDDPKRTKNCPLEW